MAPALWALQRFDTNHYFAMRGCVLYAQVSREIRGEKRGTVTSGRCRQLCSQAAVYASVAATPWMPRAHAENVFLVMML